METISTSTALADMQMKARIEQLEKQNNSFIKSIENYQYSDRMHEKQIDQFMETLLAYLGDDEIDRDVAEQLADCFGRTLSRTISVNFSITGTMELTVPFGVDVDDLSDEFDILIQPSYTSEVVLEWDDIDSIEIEEA